MTNPLLNSLANEPDITSLRPGSLKEFIGQHKLKDNLEVFINAAKTRSASLDHCLFYGPPGLGKTTLANLIAKEMGANIKSTSGPMLSKPADLAAILTNLQKQDVLFIDEIHRLSIAVEEVLYAAMEDYALDIIIGEGPAARCMRINLQPFTLVGATTRLGLISGPLRDRFGIPLRLEFYSTEELVSVVKRNANILCIDVTQDGADEIAHRSRGTPRIAIRLLKRLSDFALISNSNLVDKNLANDALNRLEVDKAGLDSNDYRYLNFIAKYYDGGPVGVETIAAGLSEQKDAIEEAIEPYLIQIGFIQRTPRGRIMTIQAMAYLNISTQNTLF
jgi:Holliday junction DNA helicase RuvB